MTEDDRVYGSRADQIHPFFKKKREWSKVKEEIVGKYIAIATSRQSSVEGVPSSLQMPSLARGASATVWMDRR